MTTDDPTKRRLAEIREHLRAPLRSLLARVRVLRATASIRALSAREFERHLRDRRVARQRDRSRSQQLFGKGAAAEKIGYLDVDDFAIVGLEAHGALYALWIAQAAMESEARDRGALLRHIFSCPKRLDWCRREGARISLEFSKNADEAKSQAFRERQARGGSRSWRKEPVTEHQLYRMEAISVRLGVSIPDGLNCGSAHDWIARMKAKPDYWAVPEKLPDWSSDMVPSSQLTAAGCRGPPIAAHDQRTVKIGEAHGQER